MVLTADTLPDMVENGRSTSISSADALLAPVLVATGSGGAEELREAMDESGVQWALLRIMLGSGTFCRRRVLFLHLNSDAAPALKRGRANAHTAFVQSFLRGDQESFHASAELRSREDLTTDALLERLGNVFITDDLGHHEAKWAVADAEQKIDKKPKKPVKTGKDGDSDDGAAGRRVPDNEIVKLRYTGREALGAAATGPWNWVLFTAPPKVEDGQEPPILSGGDGSVEEMSECLAQHQDKVLFGLLRMVFGAGRLQRTKSVFINSVGSKVSTVRRGQLIPFRPRAEKIVAEFAHCCTSMDITSAEELSPEAVIDRISRCAVADAVLDGDGASRMKLTVDAYREAQAETKRLAVEAEPEAAVEDRRTSEPREMTSEEAVRLFHADGPIDWAVFRPQDDWLRPKRSSSEATDKFRKAAIAVTCANAIAKPVLCTGPA